MINIFSTLTGLISKESLVACRTGTKLAVWWMVLSAVLVSWLVIGIPIVTIFYPHMQAYAPNLPAIITAIIGGASITYAANETRKTFENVKQVKPPANTQEETPTNPKGP